MRIFRPVHTARNLKSLFQRFSIGLPPTLSRHENGDFPKCSASSELEGFEKRRPTVHLSVEIKVNILKRELIENDALR